MVNEPELKLPSLGEPKKFAKAIVSAIDGVLDAEEERGDAACAAGRNPPVLASLRQNPIWPVGRAFSSPDVSFGLADRSFV